MGKRAVLGRGGGTLSVRVRAELRCEGLRTNSGSRSSGFLQSNDLGAASGDVDSAVVEDSRSWVMVVVMVVVFCLHAPHVNFNNPVCSGQGGRYGV